MKAPESESANPVVTNVEKSKRVYKGVRKINHDLYKLQVSEMVKNHSWWSEKPTLIGQEHTHMFHSVDSSGKTQTHSTQTGGHSHKVSFELDESGLAIPESMKIGPPVRKTKSGDVQIIVQKDAEGKVKQYDNHTHEMLYIQSEEIEVRRKNENAARMMSEYMQNRDQKLKTSTVSNTL